ncbi:hypothetical protein [Tautonia marina]|uniref:hypothetical protein n=1 Tax=Tautonia marina TaxID=2653855 RepID=UPI001260BDB7|nr:hypothetical protein [Tautonia marina]
MRSEREKCPNCEKRRVLGSDGICKACSAEYYDGAMCSRCDLDLDDWGYCINDRCPFNDRHQDEGRGRIEPVSTEEQAQIERILRRGQKSKSTRPRDES